MNTGLIIDMENVRIAALGDSITKGVVLGEENNYSVLDQNFMEIIRKSTGVEVENYGKFGSTIGFAHHVINHHSEDIARAKYTFIEYGGNDCDFYWKRIALNPEGDHRPKTALAEFRQSLEELIGRVRGLGSEPLLLSLPPIDSDSYFRFITRGLDAAGRENVWNWLGGDVEAIARWHESYNGVLFEVAGLLNVPIIDLTSPFADRSCGCKSLLCADGIHPNVQGHRFIASLKMRDIVM